MLGLHGPRHGHAITRGRVLRFAAGYDLLTWLLFLGREREFRERLLELASVRPGDAVLEIGCGTGTLAIAAARRVGSTGSVRGIDPSAEMLARARHKATRAGVEIGFETGAIEEIRHPDGSFDVALSSLMLHHLPAEVRRAGMAEVARVLKPGGRLVIADLRQAGSKRLEHVLGHRGLGLATADQVAATVRGAGLAVETRETGHRLLYAVVGTKPSLAA